MTETSSSWKAATRGYKTYAAYATWRRPHWEDNWERTVRPTAQWIHPTPSTAIPWTPPLPQPDIIIDHGRRIVIDGRRDVNAEPKLIVELSGDEKDVIIQCRCGDRISLVSLLGLETVKPIFDGISQRLRGLIEAMPQPAPIGGD